MSTTVPSAEVQQLLAAEKRAIELVTDARNRKAQRLKRAKEEAAAEIEQFKGERQLTFNKYGTEHSGSTDQFAKQLERDTAERLEKMNEWMKLTGDGLLKKLIQEVANSVQPKQHRNAQSVRIH